MHRVRDRCDKESVTKFYANAKSNSECDPGWSKVVTGLAAHSPRFWEALAIDKRVAALSSRWQW